MNMLLTLLLGLLTVVGCAPGPLPLPDINVLPNPNINADFSVAEKLQITLAFRDAQFMAVAAYEAATIDNEIYLNYFPKTVSWMLNDPSEIVRAVFKSIFVGQLDGCGKTLEDVVFSKDFDVPDLGYICIAPSYSAETINWNTGEPTIILCPSVMKHGIIGQGSTLPKLPDFPLPVTCNTLGDTTSWRMNTLGSTILHEWTHIDALVGRALTSPHRPLEGTDDDLHGNTVYGCVDTQAIANDQDAIYVADNYAWFAMEAFWSKKCQKRFSKPGPDDDKDPLYGGQAGAETHPIPGP